MMISLHFLSIHMVRNRGVDCDIRVSLSCAYRNVVYMTPFVLLEKLQDPIQWLGNDEYFFYLEKYRGFEHVSFMKYMTIHAYT